MSILPLQLCIGIRRVKQGRLNPDDSQRLPTNIAGYQFGCVGWSAHPYEQQDGAKGLIIPYCEGLEV